MDNKLARITKLSPINTRSGGISKVFLGEIDGEPALLIVNKGSFSDEIEIPKENNLIHQNDIYTSGTMEAVDSVKYSIIHPATPALIQKYKESPHVMVQETYEMYKKVILPLALEKGPNQIWIDNIFTQAEGCEVPFTTQEQEKVLYLDNEFLICPDLKWDRKTQDSLYLLVLFKDPKIYTVRELTDKHISLLLQIEKAAEEVLKIYNYKKNQTRIYFHYYPTFYRAHIHISSIAASFPGTVIGSSILLHDVIENLRICPTYYKERTMEICISEASYLYEGYRNNQNSTT